MRDGMDSTSERVGPEESPDRVFEAGQQRRLDIAISSDRFGQAKGGAIPTEKLSTPLPGVYDPVFLDPAPRVQFELGVTIAALI